MSTPDDRAWDAEIDAALANPRLATEHHENCAALLGYICTCEGCYGIDAERAAGGVA